MNVSNNSVTVMLDTMIVAGALSKTKDSEYTKAWKDSIKSILKPLGKSLKIIAPTPVCFELLKWNESWASTIEEYRTVFPYRDRAITNDILKKSAKYLLKINGNQSEDKIKQKLKISDMDAMIAAYSLEFDYYILTCNEKDFPTPYFTISNISCVEGVAKNRHTLYLLKPNHNYKFL